MRVKLNQSIRAVTLTSKNTAVGLHALNGMISTNIFIYITALFLTSYPISWVPYFFIGRTIIEIAASYFIARSLTKNILRSAMLLTIGSVISIIIMIFLLNKQWYFVPLIFSLILTVSGLITSLIAWNNVRNAFDILEFKQISSALSLASVIGKIAISLFNIWLIKKFGIVYLPYCIGLFILASAYFIKTLVPLPVIISTRKLNKTPVIRYALFRNLFIFSIILAFCYTLVDYTLRNKLASSYNSQQIGRFISMFTAITYFISIIITYFFAEKLVKSGITRLLEILPLYWIMIPIGVIFFPGMTMIAIMGAGDYIFFNLINTGRSLLLSVLPNEARILGQSYIQTIAESVGIGAASLFLIVISHYITISRLAVGILICSIILLFLIRRLHVNYVSTLKSEILLKRFNIDEHNIQSYQNIIEEHINQLLISSDPKVIRFGYSLYAHIKTPTLQDSVINHLHSPYSDIRIEAIKLIIQNYPKAKFYLDLLWELFNKENNPEVKYWIIGALDALAPKQYIDQAKEWLNHPSPEIKSAAIKIIFSSDQAKDIDLALTSLTELLNNQDPIIRRIISRILILLPAEKIKDKLSIFIADPDGIVSSNQIDFISKNNLDDLAPLVISRLLKGGVLFSTRKFVNKFSEKSLPLLKQAVRENKNNTRARNDILISLLAQIPDEKTDQILIELAQLPEILIKQAIAFNTLYRATHFRLSQQLIEKSFQFAHEEAKLIHILRLALKNTTQLHIKSELNSRIDLAFERYLSWVGVYTHSAEIRGIIPTILQGQKLDKSNAMELFITLIPDHALSQITQDIFSNNLITKFEHLSLSNNQFYDTWISQVVKITFLPEVGLSMNVMQKIFILRQVALFKNLPAEVLMIIAEELETQSMSAEQIIFVENALPTELYIIASGTVDIIRNKTLLANLKENDFFGELALIDNVPRTASAIAKSEGTLLVLNKEVFDRIINDLPQVLRSVTQVILNYLRTNLAIFQHQ